MKKINQCVYTLLIIVSCVVASPMIFKQIWETSAEKKQEPASPMAEIDITKGLPLTTTAPTTSAAETTTTTAAETTSTTTAKKTTSTSTASATDTTSTSTTETTSVTSDADDTSTTTTSETTTTKKKTTTTTSSAVKTTSKATYTEYKDTTAQTTTTAKKKPNTQYEFGKGDKSFFDDALFIGDSRTVGIKEYGSIKNADYYCEVGLSSGKARREAESGTIANMLRSKKYGKVYIMLGINEVGNDFEWTMSDFNKLINSIRTISPDSLIILEANLHVTANAETSVINNKRLNYLNSRLEALADNKTIFYIDVNPIFDDSNGNLRSECSSDGIHVYAKHYQSWSDWLCLWTLKEKK